jgi:predicted amidohydrolase YtcJ
MTGHGAYPRAELVVVGQVVVRATGAGLEMAEAVGVASGRVVAVGRAEEVRAAAAPGARVIDARGSAVVPGIHDFHLHLVGMARARGEVTVDDLRRREDVTERLGTASAPDGAWLRGRGWREDLLDTAALNRHPRLAGRLAIIYSHDSHSLWASPAALALAGIGSDTADPPGGRIERDAGGVPTGVLRERAGDRVEAIAGRIDGAELEALLAETLDELAALGITGATDAGDALVENGIGDFTALGDRASRLLEMRARIDGRLRLTINVPADAIGEAAALGMATGRPVPGATTIRGGWAKAYADGALGSHTAALFAPYSCGPATETGILRLSAAELDDRLAAGQQHGIRLAVHAIGDRAAAEVLDAMERASGHPGPIAHRIEHLQLLRPEDRGRLARLGVTASVQPVHAASDRELVEACWAGRGAHAYPWRSLAAAGALLAFGSDAPIESVNPWVGIFAAIHRRFPTDPVADWHAEQAVDLPAALGAYTIGPARGMGVTDEGHLEMGARADLAVLNVDLARLASADEGLAEVSSILTLVGGREVHRA